MIQVQPHPYVQLALKTDWTATGESADVLIAKTSYEYDLDGNVTPLDESEPLSESYEYPDDDPEQNAPMSLRETAPFKHGSEIVLFATAHAIAPRPVLRVRAALQTEEGIRWEKSLAVIGARQWKSTLFGAAYTDPVPFTEQPIYYEYAFGGRNSRNEADAFPANPVGMGYLGRGRKKAAYAGAALPHIEAPDQTVMSPSSHPTPQGFGPIPSHWHPRSQAFESLDEDLAMANQYPFKDPLPVTAHHSAPSDQWFDRPLHGPGTLSFTGLTEGLAEHQTLELRWDIPGLDLIWETPSPGSRLYLSLKADTLIVDTRKRQLHLLYRRAFTDVPKRSLVEIRVAEEESATYD